MTEIKYVFLLVGTLGFCVNLYLANRAPELVDGPMGKERPEESEAHPLKKWDKLAYWTMWTGWGLAALMLYLEKVEVISAD